MNAYLLTIGDELLIGQTVNTNAAWLGEQLSLLGLDVIEAAVVRDEAAAIRRALERGFEEADLLITTGGLGPTHDDLTKEVAADFLGARLVTDEATLARIERYYTRRGRPLPDTVRTLADVPEGSDVLENPAGTAPGLWYADAEQILIVLPGVPSEMKGIFEAAVRPRLEAHEALYTIAHRTLLTTGLPESSLQNRIGDLVDDLPTTLSLAYLPSTSGVRLRLTARADTHTGAEGYLDHFETRLRERIGAYVYGTGNDTLEAVVGRMLKGQGLTVAVAESATGGLVADRLTDVAGASAYVLGGVVAYANRVKIDVLGVAPETLEEGGAVSEATAQQMARGVRERFGADIGLSTTGIAGPTGATPGKPVGTLCIGCAAAGGTEALRLQFVEDRRLNKELFSTAALEMLRRRLLQRDAAPA